MRDGLAFRKGLPVAGYTHKMTVISTSRDPAHVSMPAVHQVAALA
ncbi:MAG: hypothetical protein M0035_12980 [Actinomycetota bacterium]|nr:hypothetical protein [Actinomycetota bacterium]